MTATLTRERAVEIRKEMGLSTPDAIIYHDDVAAAMMGITVEEINGVGTKAAVTKSSSS
jgi:hypothetical protein